MSKKILVVDDEKPIADILQFNLKKEGYKFFVHMMVMKLKKSRGSSTRFNVIRYNVT